MNTIEIFAGGGGAAMGLHRAGLHTIARCEWDKDACATLRAAAEAGFLDAADVIEGDVRAVDWSPYVGRCDVLWASPPCQAWSSAGKRLGAADDRNLWPATFDVADTVRPTWLLAENVTGLLMHRGDCDGKGAPDSCPGCYWHRHILPETRKRFASVQWAELNSSAFGVPQHRRRVYLVCGPRPIVWPVPTHGDPVVIRQRGLFAAPLLPWHSIADAVGHTGTVQAGIASSDTGARGRPRATSAPAPALSAASRLYFRPAPTLTGGSTRAHTNGRSVMSASKATRKELTEAGVRSYTTRECLRLMAWPEAHPAQGSGQSKYRQICNGCTPPVVELLARAVIASTPTPEKPT